MCHCPLSNEVEVELVLVTKVDGVGTWPVEYIGGDPAPEDEVG